MSAYSLSGKVALVTGGARGIGFATAQQLVARGAKVIVVDLHDDAVEQAAAALGGGALGIVADVTDRRPWTRPSPRRSSASAAWT
jgi:NAD(P)-dependent dehydrogenase (short-subunit alcohol dehydrogenase family)